MFLDWEGEAPAEPIPCKNRFKFLFFAGSRLGRSLALRARGFTCADAK